MRIKRTYEIITNSGKTSDIIEAVMSAYRNDNDSQIEILASQLKGDTIRDTCKNIFKYLVDNVKYVADVSVQEVRSPARLIHDGVGDCKSYSIFTAVILRYLGVEHFFRFVSYSNKKLATHVYVVAINNGHEIPIDAVAYVQAYVPFGNELKYTFRADMSELTTTIAYLAGVEQNRIGSVQSDIDPLEFLNSGAFNVWLDEPEYDITQAKGYLLSEWDKYWSIYAYANAEFSAIEALNRLQYIGAMIRFYNEYKHNTDMLIKGGFAFDYVIANSEFDSLSVDPKDRDFFNDIQHDRIIELTELLNSGSKDFIDFWMINIVDANIQYNVSGIGSISDLRTNLKKTGGYYLYTYVSDIDAQKYGAEVFRKRLIQKRMLDLNKDVLTKSKSMTSAEIENLIYSGCVVTWGASPQNAMLGLKPRIGIDPATILTILKIVAAVISLIVGIFKGIQSIKNVTEKTVSEGAPSENEWNVTSANTGTKTPVNISQASSLLIPLLIAGSLLFKNKSSKKK